MSRYTSTMLLSMRYRHQQVLSVVCLAAELGTKHVCRRVIDKFSCTKYAAVANGVNAEDPPRETSVYTRDIREDQRDRREGWAAWRKCLGDYASEARRKWQGPSSNRYVNTWSISHSSMWRDRCDAPVLIVLKDIRNWYRRIGTPGIALESDTKERQCEEKSGTRVLLTSVALSRRLLIHYNSIHICICKM